LYEKPSFQPKQFIPMRSAFPMADLATTLASAGGIAARIRKTTKTA